MRSIWLRARLDTPPRFCGLEIGNAVPHHRLRGIPKGERTVNDHGSAVFGNGMPYHVTLLDAAGLEVEAWAVDGDGRRVPNFGGPR